MSEQHNLPPAPPEAAPPRKPLFAALGLVAVLALAGLAAYLLRPRSEPVAVGSGFSEDPRLTYDGPLRNIRPEVKYVGDQACAGCHAAETESFRRHPMGRSLAPIAQLAGQEPYDSKHHNPFSAFDSRFLVERRGDRVWHRQVRLDAQKRPVYRLDHEVLYAVGSGSHGRSYLALRRGDPLDGDSTAQGADNGFLFQTPISWYSQKQIWDTSPGFQRANLLGRPIDGKCLFCHSNRAHDVEGYQNRYELPVFDGHAIGCERCHGPGELHAASADPADIVNPSWPGGRLAPKEREGVCAQCHLEGVVRILHRGRREYDFRPGLPLEAFWSVFVHPRTPGAGQRAVSHMEQMSESRCFRETRGARKLGCVSCHNPHDPVGPERRVQYYRGRCLQCHDETQGQHGCTESLARRKKKSPADSCIDCHMPRTELENIAHTADSDHRIPRRAGKGTAEPSPEEAPVRTPLVPFSLTGDEGNASEAARDRGVALMRAALFKQAPMDLAAGQSLPLLDEAVRECPADVEAWELRGWALMRLERREPALAAFEEALRQNPGLERALAGAGGLAQMLGRNGPAESYWRQAVQANPWLPAYRRNLTLLLRQHQKWDEARVHCRAWMALDPESTEARSVWITCLLQAGKKAEARAAFAQIEALEPPNLQSLRTWFGEQMR